jgi:hypothetical protein
MRRLVRSFIVRMMLGGDVVESTLVRVLFVDVCCPHHFIGNEYFALDAPNRLSVINVG